MADPTDTLLTDEPAITPDEPVDDGSVKISKEQLEAFQRQQQQLAEMNQTLTDMRVAMVNNQAPPPPPPQTDGAEQFFADPEKATEKVVQRMVGQQAAEMNNKISELIIQNYKAGKTADPFYQVVVGDFDKELAKMGSQIAFMPKDNLLTLLNKLWYAAVGEYSSRKVAERPKAPPTNLGGGGGAPNAGPKAKRHLREIDAVSYNWAMQNNFSEEEMAELAEQIEAGE